MISKPAAPAHAHKPRIGQNGIVLPLVLVFILVFASLSMIGIRAARTGQDLTRAMIDQLEAEKSFISTESRTLFRWLTAQPVIGGMDLSAEAKYNPLSFQDGLPASENALDFWSAQSGIRRDDNGILIHYQDSAGLISLNGTNEDELILLMEAMGFDQLKSNRLIARLLDYTDSNSIRRFQGAEAPAYRLLKKPPPANAPLRHALEARAVLDWAEESALWDNDQLLMVATAEQRSFGLNPALAAPALRALLGDDRLQQLAGSGDVFSQRQAIPSPRARMRYEQFIDGPSSRYKLIRIIEYERRPVAADRPFYRYSIGTRRQSQDVYDQYDDIKALLPAGS
ncbi:MULTISPECIES: type II secretion system protein GspK [unclassified Iodidimonas]|jgi:hypothetical protein|uniref:type II secretion system protein GspK n=1 Tax=unclassified Iodidimonas TaxID=2626145 RepID=UPI0024821F18|nr:MULTISPECIES: type II secretion system protein GspK [unclassified Iodidimonas]